MKAFISVIVYTYNSSKFVLETLKSIKDQTFENIELIISDDASVDETVQICTEWIENNKSRFTRTIILTVPKNTGIPANFNRGILASNGNWIKPIAGDDALLPNCIQDNMDFVSNNPEIRVLYSYNKVYKNTFHGENFLRLNPDSFPINIISYEITANDQYKILLKGDRVSFAPTLFIERKALLDTGLPDDDLFSEHYPTILKLTKKGYKLHFFEKETVLYRQHANATNNTTKDYILKPHYFKTEDFRLKYIYPYIPTDLHLSQRYSWAVNQIFKLNFFNRKTKINKAVHYLLNTMLNPFKYIIYIKSHYIKKYKDNLYYQ